MLGRALFSVALGRDLRLADLTSRRALEHGLTATVSASDDYGPSQRFAASALESGFAGVRYLVRHDPAQKLYGVALFAPAGVPVRTMRSGPKVTTVRSRPSSCNGPCASSGTGSCPRRSSASRLTSGDTRPASPSMGRRRCLTAMEGPRCSVYLSPPAWRSASSPPPLRRRWRRSSSERRPSATTAAPSAWSPASTRPSSHSLARSSSPLRRCVAGSRSSGVRRELARIGRPRRQHCYVAEAARPEPRAALRDGESWEIGLATSGKRIAETARVTLRHQDDAHWVSAAARRLGCYGG